MTLRRDRGIQRRTASAPKLGLLGTGAAPSLSKEPARAATRRRDGAAPGAARGAPGEGRRCRPAELAPRAARALSRRQEKPVWWEFFDRHGPADGELQERDSKAIGGSSRPGRGQAADSLVWPFRFRRSSITSVRATQSTTLRRGGGRGGSRRSTRRQGRGCGGSERRGRPAAVPVPAGRCRPLRQRCSARARSVLAATTRSSLPSRSSSAVRRPLVRTISRPRRARRVSTAGTDQGPPGGRATTRLLG
jgi:hypothetical protein